jgi:plasmid replication initiation protein
MPRIISARLIEASSKSKDLSPLLYKYKLFGHFHARVIKPAVEQINKHSNFIADYELIKKYPASSGL